MESLYKQNSQRLITVILALNLLMISAAVFFLHESYLDYRHQAQTTAENLSLSIEREISDTFNVSDVLLASIAEEFEFFSNDLPQFTKILNSRTGQLKRLTNLFVIDAQGTVIYHNNESVSFQTHPFFKETLLRLQQDSADRMLVSQPLQEHTSGAWSLLLARRIPNRNGSFAGIVTATIPLEYFQNLFNALKIGTWGSIALRDERLQLIVRHPSLMEGKLIGSSKFSDEFREALGKNPNEGVYDVGSTSIDGITRLHSFRRNAPYGYYINVGIAKSDYLDEWQDHLIQSAVLIAFFILISLTLARMLLKSWKNQQIEETKRREADEVLRKLSRVAEQSPVAIVITDLTGNIEFVNPKFVQVSGYSIDEVLGHNPSILQSGETARVVYEQLWQTILAGNVWEGDFCNKKKSGELFWEHSTISALRNAEGRITHFVAIKEDITNKIEVMDQLLQSQKMQSIGQLAGGMAHDFNNILSIINGYTCLMQLETQNDDPLREYLAFIQEASTRAGGLTHALLAFSRKQIIKPKVQNINDVLVNVSALLERTMRSDISFRMFFEENPLYVQVDSIQIDHVLINIATNAMDAMPNGGKFSIVTSRRIMDAEFICSKKFGEPGVYAVVEISDSGIGMDDESVRRVFEPFYTTKEVGKGTGLGMSMAFGIIKQHKGFIEVISQTGKGTTFTLFLPLMSKEQAKDEGIEPVNMGTLPRGDETILLAEDEPNVRRLMQKLLTSCGYTVIAAEDGQEAMDKFRTYGNVIDLLFFDIIMPRKNGREAYMEILSIRSDIKVLFNSGYPANELHKMERLDVSAEFLSKPVHPKTLMTKIREILDR